MGGLVDFDDETKVTKVAMGPPAASTSSSGKAYLIVLSGSNVGEMYTVDGDLTVGRSPDNSITLLDDGISRLHCKLVTLATGDVVIQDNASTNGTFANGKPIDRHFLQDGDKIQIGSTTILKFSYHDDLEQNFQKQMYESALRDGLTNAFNKRYFTDRLHAEFAYALRHDVPLSLVMMDIDHFKKLNDTWGHLAGDYVLQRLSDQVSTTVRTEDVFSRYGGEEFAVISRGIDKRNATIMAERIRESIESYQFIWDGERLPVTLSVGVAALPDPVHKTPEDLIGAADKALYRAKNGGRNKVCVDGE